MKDAAPHNVVIAGSGPAGLTAAIYTARANLAPLMLDGSQAGGQLTLTTDVENYPGFPDGILGPRLIQDMRAQAERFGTVFRAADVTNADLRSRPFRLTINDEESVLAKTLIIATGATANPLGLPSEARLLGHGVSTCATCDGFFFRGQPLVVVGGGDSALEEALFLTKFASHVLVLHRRDTLRASKIMRDRAFTNENISFRWNAVVEEILGDETVSGLRLRDVRTNATEHVACKGVFIAIGHTPNTRVFQGQLDLDANGYIHTTQGAATSIAGVFASGDVQDPHYRQAITAAGSGCMAALDAERFLEANG